MARAATVTPVPIAMMKVAATPAANSPCDSAKTRMMIAPEHGLMPTAKTVDSAFTRARVGDVGAERAAA